jgi:protocatechuate 3,4-dioxygenase beta subunit
MKRIIFTFIVALLTQFSSATTVTGFVFSSTDSSVVYAYVYYTNAATGITYPAFTQLGGYRLDIPEGNYNVLIDDLFNVYQDATFGPIPIFGVAEIRQDFIVNPINIGDVDNFIRGTIRSSDTQTPVSGASVQVFLNGNQVQSLWTDASGAYRFDDLLPNRYDLFVQANGYNYYVHSFQMENTTELTHNVWLDPLADSNSVVVEGVVVSSHGQNPLSGVSVRLSSVIGTFDEEMTTGPDGRFLFPLVPHGTTYILETYKEGYLPVTRLLNAGTLDLDLTIEMESDNPDNLGLISGNVQLSNGENVGEAIIELLPVDSSGHYNQTFTDPFGNYSMEVPAGAYIIAMQFWYETGDNATIVTRYYHNTTDINAAEIVNILEDSHTGNIDFIFSLPELHTAIISGTVRDSEESPIQGAFVTLYRQNVHLNDFFGVSGETITGADGQYVLEASVFSNNNSVVLGADVDGYAAMFYDGQSSIFAADAIIIQSDTVVAGIDYNLMTTTATAAYNISGEVLEEGTNQAIPDAYVILTSANGYYDITLVDSLGAYGFSQVPEGSYFIQFISSSHVPGYFDDALSWENATPLAVASDLFGIDARLTLFDHSPHAGNISGIVTNSAGNTLSGVTIMIMDSNSNMVDFVVTDANGNYTLQGIGNGYHSILVTAVDYHTENVDVDVLLSETISHNLDFELSSFVNSVKPEDNLPGTFELSQNYPNPFNPATKIAVDVQRPGYGELLVFNIRGQKVRTLHRGYLGKGRSEFVWNGRNDNKVELCSGFFYYQLRLNGKTETRSMLFLK